MLIAAINLALVFVLFTTDRESGRPPSDLGAFLPWMAIGCLPFVGTAALLVWVVAQSRAGNSRRQIANTLLVITLCGLPLMVLFGFWAGFLAAAQMYPSGSPAGSALYIWQFFFVAAVVADLVTAVLALVARLAPPIQ
jgi:hypothetical protein